MFDNVLLILVVVVSTGVPKCLIITRLKCDSVMVRGEGVRGKDPNATNDENKKLIYCKGGTEANSRSRNR